jgi:hypothetical protein
MKKRRVGRPKEIKGDTLRCCYNLTLLQANFIVAQANKHEVTESEMLRTFLDYLMAQYALQEVKR